MIDTRLDDELVENIVLSAHVSSTIVLVGTRQFDRFLLRGPEEMPRTLTLERLCHESTGALATWVYDPARNELSLTRLNERDRLGDDCPLPTQPGATITVPLIDALDGFAQFGEQDADVRYALLVNAGLLVEDPAAPRDGDFRLIRAIERFARVADRRHVLFLRTGRTTALPAAIRSVPQVRTVHIPQASRDVLHAYALARGRGIAQHCAMEVEAVARTLGDAAEDWTLDQVNALVQTAERQGVSHLQDLEELARAIRVGATHSPWAGDRIREAVAGAEETITRRVIGQPSAVEAVVSALRKAVVGLSQAHQSQGSQAPRAIFFFAGPTGTGKTELAKAISHLVFGQEQLLRFDCGELQQEHAVARLIGAPPGYVGYDRGGELTEGIRAKPNSVVLFDEIEKAHPRLLDTLLGVLDDGRLTSGQGETAYFGQTVLIFTSNLGMYEEVTVGHSRAVVRRPRFTYDTEFPDIQREVREAIREEFVTRLGRPELLGRFGGAQSIVVFDYLRDLDSVCRKFVANVAASCRRLHGIELEVDKAVIERVVDVTRSRTDALVLGGRGLKPELDRLLTDPLADYLFTTHGRHGRIYASLDATGQTAFEASRTTP